MAFLSFFSSFLILTLLVQMYGTLCSSSAAVDHLSLSKMKSMITEDPQGFFISWNDSLPFCLWQGVTCGRRHQRVTSLNLTGGGLVGSLSPYIGNLSFLRYMIFKHNQLHGNIPSEIGRLSRLQLLSLANNSFTGEIPANISSCSKLWHINLSTNMLSGKIHIICSLPKIQKLGLDKNNFTGGIPSSIGNLTFLEQLYVSNCPLGGSIPNSFNKLENLQLLSIGENGLVGEFPSFFFNLSMLEVINIPENQLHGSLPSYLCLSQPQLRRLELGRNQFTGFLPPSLSNCSELKTIDISENHFTGEVNIDFGKLQYLYYLGLGPNNFESKGLDNMKFFDSLSNCSNLETLEFIHMNLRGVLPHSLGNFSSKLNYLDLNSNYISGNIPSSIGNLVGLTTLDLSENYFTGMIPESIGNLQNLVRVNLTANAFSGIIPRSIGNLSFVIELGLGGNQLEGTIPSSIGSCTNLIGIELFGNNLSGGVPIELYKLSSLSIGLDLARNNLSGVLPQEIGNLKNIGTLDLSHNCFSGELPSSFGSCSNLEFLNLSSNFFGGSIAETLSSLKALADVDMSHNNFSGHIPTYIKKLSLKHLDLSYNNFEGVVPVEGVFANASAISVTGNNGLCGGIPELNLTKCMNTASDSTKRSRKLSVRIIVAISLSSTFAGSALVSFLIFYFCKKKGEKASDVLSVKSFEKISYGTLFKATEGFSSENLIGTGSFASVYKGVLEENGLIVAIKVLNLQLRGGYKSFMAECDALKNIRHRNLVKIITSCSSSDYQGNDFKALVYDFMPNGSLESQLHSVHHTLNLVQRINILKDVACALNYLHCLCGNVVVHCDLKPSNILLDADMVAHVGDFGLAKILTLIEVSNANRSSSSSVIRGTIGYAPPEYGLGNEVSTSGDIYSYGILLLEMLTSKKPVDPMFQEGLSLHSYARSALFDGSVLQIVDQVLQNEDVNDNSLISLVKIGVQCSSESSQDRMDIGTIIHNLFAITVTTTS